jgi:hypothetical protein
MNNWGSQKKTISNSDFILNRINSTKLDSSQTTINSAAIQDHLMKSFGLSGLNSFGQRTKTYKKPDYLKNSKRTLSNAGKRVMGKGIEVKEEKKGEFMKKK